MKGIAIIAAAGRSERAGVDKIWMKSGGVTTLERATAPFFKCPTVDEIILVVSPDRTEDATALFEGREKPCRVVRGGATRTQSVKGALDIACEIAGDEDAVVAVHDGARPYVTVDLITECMTVAAKAGSAVPVIPSSDSLRRVTEGGSRPLPREEVVRVQTPQCFSLRALHHAYGSGKEATDDATLYEKYVGAITLVKGEENNVKITYLSDIYNDTYSRVGVGFDVHPLVPGRRLVLGGIEIPFEKGLDGHSDADVLVHAIMDALLTAAHLPDIGHLFPPDDPAYEGADSVELLREVVRRVSEAGYFPTNVSATVMAERPKLAPYLSAMEVRLARAIGVSPKDVSLAATTTERLGIVGEGRGIAAQAVALLGEKKH